MITLDELDKLIAEAEELRGFRHDSPRVMMWKLRTRRFVKETYGGDYVDIFERSTGTGRVVVVGRSQADHLDSMRKAIEFLNQLPNEPVLVRDVVEALSQNIERTVPESDLKHRVQDSLRAITTNETFAAVAGSFMAEMWKHFGRT